VSFLLASFLLAAADPSAAAPQSATTTTPAAQPAKREKRICKADESFTGSRFKKKVCLTETEWANRSATTANDLKNMGAR
jgi:hypothetical protein